MAQSKVTIDEQLLTSSLRRTYWRHNGRPKIVRKKRRERVWKRGGRYFPRTIKIELKTDELPIVGFCLIVALGIGWFLGA